MMKIKGRATSGVCILAGVLLLSSSSSYAQGGLDAQALSIARQVWIAKFVRCGNFFRSASGDFAGVSEYIVKVSPRTSDRLNGISWRGYTFYLYNAVKRSAGWEPSPEYDTLLQGYRLRPMPSINLDPQDIEPLDQDPVLMDLTVSLDFVHGQWLVNDKPLAEEIGAEAQKRPRCA